METRKKSELLIEFEPMTLYKLKFGFTRRVDKGWITTVKDLESWRFKR